MTFSSASTARAALAFLALSLAPLAPAWSDYVDDITALYDAGNPQAAFELALKHLGEGEGDPRFDYIYGVAAIDSGFSSQGVFALDRVLLLQPDDHRARLEAARGYFVLEQYDRARREFETVLASEPPESVATNIHRFINAIRVREGRYRSTAATYASIDRGWDSNVNSAPLSPEFESPTLGAGVLGSGSTSIGDWYSEANAGASLTIPVAPGRYLVGKMDFNKRINDSHTDFNTGAITASVGLNENVERIQMKITLKGQDYYLDNQRYRSIGGLSLEWTDNISDQFQINGFATLFEQSYPSLVERDSRLLNAGIGFVKAFSGPTRPILFGTAFLGKESPRTNSTSADAAAHRDIKGLGGGLQLSLDDSTSLTGSLTWQNSRYQGDDLIFVTRRDDDFYNASVTLKHLLDDHFSVSANYNLTDNDSNVTINRYDREVFSVGVRYEY